MATLAQKLKLKPSSLGALVSAPDGYRHEIGPLPQGVQLVDSLKGQYDWIQIFVKTQAELEKMLPRILKALKPISIVWISYPKGTSGIQTDLTRDKGWDSLRGGGVLKRITLVSVNDTWSAFALRPYKPGEARESW